MAFKTTFQIASINPVCDGYRFADSDGRSVVISGFRGDRVRVTVEEEVSECCEKWRQALCFTGGHGRWDELIGPVIYCPTCREKL